jgi:hypothetical protein
MTEANLATARKVILCAGLLVAALLFVYPHWRMNVDLTTDRDAGMLALDQDIGRFFIASPPAHFKDNLFFVRVRINYVRQITEVALALLLTFGLTLALKKAAGGRKHNVEE